MKLIQVFVALAVAVVFASPALACGDKDKKAKASKASKDASAITVSDAAKLSKAGKIVMVDANGDNVRKEQGVVPGAKLLASYDKFDAQSLKVSKSDTLVFYCYNEKCGAAPAAAKLARKQGFKAKVMHAGIMGWKKAGQPVDKI